MNTLNQNTDPVVIVSSARTPIGAFQGMYSNIPAPVLGGFAIKQAIEKASVDPNLITEVLMGCVLPAGVGQAPARQASIKAGLANSVPCTTINKMCGSGLKTIVQAYHSILADENKIIVAGGMENMSLAPYLLPKARSGLRLGHGQVIDHMFYDGLEDAHTDKSKETIMGYFAQDTAYKYKFSREEQDHYARESAKRAIHAVKNKLFTNEIAPVTYLDRNKIEHKIDTDETPGKIDIEKISQLKPVFVRKDSTEPGSVTAANSSSISDGAAAVVLMRLSKAKKLGLTPQAKIIDYTEVAQEPAWFTTAPVKAIKSLLDKLNISVNNIDLFEINEAFAVVAMAAMHDLDIGHDKVNIYGGACALGHPVGATGARIVTTLINALHNTGKSTGIASLCIGGGEALALCLERI